MVMKKRRLWLVAMVLLLAVPLAFLLSRAIGGFVRDVVAMPILYLVWIGRLYVRAVPQVLFWGALLVFGVALIVIRALVGRTPSGEDEQGAANGAEIGRAYAGRVERLRSQIYFAGRSTYFRRRLAQRLGTLMVQSLGYGEQYRLEHIERGLDALDAPPEIRAFLREGGQLVLPSRSAGLLDWLKRRLRGRKGGGAHDVDLESVVRFLEDRLEVS